MKIKRLDILCWIVSGILISIYVYILYLGLFPNVCKEYQMYYIDETLVDWPGYNGLNYTLGEKLYFGLDYDNTLKNRGLGWGNKESKACWTDGTEAKLYFDLSNSNEKSLVLSFEIEQCLTDKVDVIANEVLLGTIQKNDKIFMAIIPKESIKNGFLELTFIIDEPIRPCDVSDSLDQRQLGVMLKSVEINAMKQVCDEIVSFTFNENLQMNEISANDFQGEGWSHTEEYATWTIGNYASLFFDLEKEKKSMEIELNNIAAENVIEVVCNGVIIGSMSKEKGTKYEFLFDSPLQGETVVEFSISNPIKPCDISDSNDERLLGIYVSKIHFGD